MINKRAAPGSQVHARNCFASETAAQRFDRRINAAEQKARQRDAKNRDAGQSSFWLFIHLRKAELQKLFILRHLGSDQLPDDDAGQDYLQIIADHLCQLGADYLRWWARDHAPWASEEYIENVIMQTRDGKQWKPAALGREVSLTNAERRLLDIRTFRPVDRSPAQRKKDSKAKHADHEAERRRKAGARPRAMSEAQTKPWLAMGKSESTFRRRKRKHRDSGDSNSCAIHYSISMMHETLSGAPPPQGGSWARAEADVVERPPSIAAREAETPTIASSM